VMLLLTPVFLLMLWMWGFVGLFFPRPKNLVELGKYFDSISLIFVSIFLTRAFEEIQNLTSQDEWWEQKKSKRGVVINIEKAKSFLRTDFGFWFIPLGFRYARHFISPNKYTNEKIKEKIYGVIEQLDSICFKISTYNVNQTQEISKEVEDINKKLNDWDLSGFENGTPPTGKLKNLSEWIGLKQVASAILIYIILYFLKTFGLV
jgi:hypothetical protein